MSDLVHDQLDAVRDGGFTRRRMLTVGGFSVAAAALLAARGLVGPGDAVLVKASRSVALEGIAPELAKDPA